MNAVIRPNRAPSHQPMALPIPEPIKASNLDMIISFIFWPHTTARDISAGTGQYLIPGGFLALHPAHYGEFMALLAALIFSWTSVFFTIAGHRFAVTGGALLFLR